MATGSAAGTVRVWDTAPGKRLVRTGHYLAELQCCVPDLRPIVMAKLLDPLLGMSAAHIVLYNELRNNRVGGYRARIGHV